MSERFPASYEPGSGNVLSHFANVATPMRKDENAITSQMGLLWKSELDSDPPLDFKAVHLRKRQAHPKLKGRKEEELGNGQARTSHSPVPPCPFHDGDEEMEDAELFFKRQQTNNVSIFEENVEMSQNDNVTEEPQLSRKKMLLEWQRKKAEEKESKILNHNIKHNRRRSRGDTHPSNQALEGMTIGNTGGFEDLESMQHQNAINTGVRRDWMDDRSCPTRDVGMTSPSKPSHASSYHVMDAKSPSSEFVDHGGKLHTATSTTEVSTNSESGSRSFEHDQHMTLSAEMKKRWPSKSDLELMNSPMKITPSEFLARDMLEEKYLRSIKTDKEKAMYFKKRFTDAYGVIIYSVKELERLHQIRADQKDEIQILRLKVQKQSELIETLTLSTDDSPLSEDGMLGDGLNKLHPQEKKIQDLCRHVGRLAEEVQKKNQRMANLYHERDLCLRELNQFKMIVAASCRETRDSPDSPIQSSKRIVQELQSLLKDKEQLTHEVVALRNMIREFKSYKWENESLRSELDHLRQGRTKYRNHPDVHEAALAQARSKSEKLCTELESLRCSMQSQLEHKDALICSQDKKIQEMNQYMAYLQKALDASKEQLEKSRDSEDRRLIADSHLNETRHELCQLRTAHEQLQNERNLKKFELEQIGNEMQKHISSLQEKLHHSELVRRVLHNKVMELRGNIRVFCRVRPVLSSENTADRVFTFPDYDTERRQIELQANPKAHVGYGQSNQTNTIKKYLFDFDMIFDGSCRQEDVFAEVSMLIQSALDGYNICIFAYGQTGSGKTYTMQGLDSNSHMGIVGRSISHIFQSISSLESAGWSYTLHLQVVEIYNEILRDLLATSGSTDKIEVRLDSEGKPSMTNTCIYRVESEMRSLQLLRTAFSRRSTKCTNMNDRSSRSHCVITFQLHGIHTALKKERSSTIHMVDLAGSERLNKSGSGADRELLREAQAINKSLSALGNVIAALAQKSLHIPFRDSKLTHFLSPSLGGDSKALMICNLSPSSQHREESLNSLRFAKTVNSCQVAVPKASRTNCRAA